MAQVFKFSNLCPSDLLPPSHLLNLQKLNHRLWPCVRIPETRGSFLIHTPKVSCSLSLLPSVLSPSCQTWESYPFPLPQLQVLVGTTAFYSFEVTEHINFWCLEQFSLSKDEGLNFIFLFGHLWVISKAWANWDPHFIQSSKFPGLMKTNILWMDSNFNLVKRVSSQLDRPSLSRAGSLKRKSLIPCTPPTPIL